MKRSAMSHPPMFTPRIHSCGFLVVSDVDDVDVDAVGSDMVASDKMGCQSVCSLVPSFVQEAESRTFATDVVQVMGFLTQSAIASLIELIELIEAEIEIEIDIETPMDWNF